MKRHVLLALLLAVTVSACGDDGAAGDSSTTLTDAERAWCSFGGATAEDAQRFDVIFEAGLVEGLNMDAVNAKAAALRSEYEAEGLTGDAAVQAVSDDLMDDEVFIEACKAAYAANAG